MNQRISKKPTKKNNVSPDDYLYISKKKLLIILIPLFLLITILSAIIFIPPQIERDFLEKSAVWLYEKPQTKKYIQARWLPKEYILAQILPHDGFQTKLVLGDIVNRMGEEGIIDIEKLEEVYEYNGGIPPEMKKLLTGPSNTPIRVTKENSSWLINILWPLGLSNKMTINEKSPIAGENVGNFASTGGWTLGKDENGCAGWLDRGR